jgi:hypothetical protein
LTDGVASVLKNDHRRKGTVALRRRLILSARIDVEAVWRIPGQDCSLRRQHHFDFRLQQVGVGVLLELNGRGQQEANKADERDPDRWDFVATLPGVAC